MQSYKGHKRAHYMGAWSYVGLNILYCIPLVGFVFLLVHAFSTSHENRCHYARSFFAAWLLALIITGVLIGLYFLLVDEASFNSLFKEIAKNADIIRNQLGQ